MTPEQFQRCEQVFRAACEQPAADRPAYVRRAVADDDAVRDAVLQMLAHDHTPQVDFANPFGSAVRGLSERVFAGATSGETLPDRIGAYRIVRKIGEGGFGVVYLAEQDNPRRTVALKVLRGTAATPDTFKRFEYEAFILGRLHHPGIAQIYEAGVAHVPLAATRSDAPLDAAARTQTPTFGRRAESPGSAMLATPYFAMEYVDGPNLLAFADVRTTDRTPLDTRGRLELIARVCDALQHAHQHGVIHRDLKPENILVVEEGLGVAVQGSGIRAHGLEGDRPDTAMQQAKSGARASPNSEPRTLNPFAAQPKILDFGVARLQEFDEQLTIVQTRAGQLVGTPAYMSPEQVGGDSSAVDTRSDVYAVGVLLYRLLCGRPPYELYGRSLSEIAGVIRDQPPAPLRTSGATQRSGKFDADVTAIVMKALAKERGRRYQSAAELAADIRRHLAGLPIEAKRDSALYILRTALKRYRGLVAAGSAAVLLLAAAALIFFFQARENARLAHEADEHRMRADTQAEKLRRSLYYANIGYAQAAAGINDAERMRRVLSACPQDLRGWEWRYLSRLADRSSRTLRVMERGLANSVVSRDGRRLLCSDHGQTFHAYDLDTMQKLYGLEVRTPAMAINPDGSRFALVRSDGQTEIRETDTGCLLVTLRLRADERMVSDDFGVGDCAFSMDGERLITIGPAGRIAVWAVATGDLIHSWNDPAGSASAMDVTPDGSRVVTGTLEGTVRLWDLASGELLRSCAGFGSRTKVIAISPDSRLAVATHELTPDLRAWDIATGQVVATWKGNTGWSSWVCFSPDGARIMTSGLDGLVRIWDTQTHELVDVLRGHRESTVMLAALAKQGFLLSSCLDGECKWWPLPFRADVPTFQHGLHDASALDVTADGRTIAGGGYYNFVRLFDASSLGQIGWFTAHEGRLISVRVGPARLLPEADAARDEAWNYTLLTAGADGLVKLWDPCGTEIRCFVGHAGSARATISADGSFVASGDTQGILKVWDAETGHELFAVPAHATEVYGLSFSRNGDRLATCGQDGFARVWDPRSGSRVVDLPRHPTAIYEIAVSPDASRIFTAGGDGIGRLWDSHNGRPLATCVGHAGPVLSCAFHPDGNRVVTGGEDRSVRLWEASSGEEVVSLAGHSRLVLRVACSADGRRIVSSAFDSTMRIWESASE